MLESDLGCCPHLHHPDEGKYLRGEIEKIEISQDDSEGIHFHTLYHLNDDSVSQESDESEKKVVKKAS